MQKFCVGIKCSRRGALTEVTIGLLKYFHDRIQLDTAEAVVDCNLAALKWSRHELITVEIHGMVPETIILGEITVCNRAPLTVN